MQSKALTCTLLFVLLVGLLGVTGCSSQPGKVEGTVTDASSGKPLAQMRVVVYALTKAENVTQMDTYIKGDPLHELSTDENGRYTASLKPGTYTVQVWANEQKVGDYLLKIEPGRVETVDFQVQLPSP
jgi:5-hydroxyisourate hydrolase-like protein (transthyretin family)